MPKRFNSTVSLTLEEAKGIYQLYAACIASEKHFHNCQCASYRSFVNGAAQSAETKRLFEVLKEKIKELEAADTARVRAAEPVETTDETDKEGV